MALDRNGMSTWTDYRGVVENVYDDGDLGVYRCNIDNTDFDRMGETWTPLGFADFDHYQKYRKVIVPLNKDGNPPRIDFNSKWATIQVGNAWAGSPSLLEYKNKAGEGGVWDFKNTANESNIFGNHRYYGSLLFGKYASARDAGNFFAGIIAEESGVPELIHYGFGLYNKNGNNKPLAFLEFMFDLIDPFTGTINMINTRVSGEDKLSNAGIEAGRHYVRKRK